MSLELSISELNKSEPNLERLNNFKNKIDRSCKAMTEIYQNIKSTIGGKEEDFRTSLNDSLYQLQEIIAPRLDKVFCRD